MLEHCYQHNVIVYRIGRHFKDTLLLLLMTTGYELNQPSRSIKYVSLNEFVYFPCKQVKMVAVKSQPLGTVFITLEHPGKQINLGRNRHRLQRALLGFVGDDSCAIPFKEPIEHTERSFHCDFDEFATFDLGLQSLRSKPQISRIRHNLGDLAEIEHDVGNRTLPSSTFMGESTEDITQSYKSSQLLSRWCKNGELVEPSVSHDFNRIFTWDIGPDCGDWF